MAKQTAGGKQNKQQAGWETPSCYFLPLPSHGLIIRLGCALIIYMTPFSQKHRAFTIRAFGC
jgi:hypothetical protein